MRHKHADVIIAFAEGKQIQWRRGGMDWTDTNTINGLELSDLSWRIKPASPQYRVALMKNDGSGNPYPFIIHKKSAEKGIEEHYNFSRWLTDWTEYEV